MSHASKPSAPGRSRRVLLYVSGAVLLSAVSLLPAAAASSAPAAAPPGAAAGGGQEVIRPEGALAPSAQSPAQVAAFAEWYRNRREAVAESLAAPVAARSTVDGVASALSGIRPNPKPKPKVSPPIPLEEVSEALLVRRNNRNTIANGASGSNLAEPAAANEGNAVFYTGNTYASSSTDLGVTWANVAIPAGPAEAPNACCDGDVVRAHSQDRIFSIMLYLNTGGTNGVIRIFVRNAPTAAPSCTYLIDPGGAANNVVPDYPHMALTSGFLYLSANNLTNGTTWRDAQVRRFNLAQISACGAVTINTFTHVGTVGHKILTPVEGAQNITDMYFASIESDTSLRVFTWPEAAATPTSVVRTVAASSFTNPDCRGGTGNADFIERGTSWSSQGFRMRGTVHGSRVTWFWHSNANGSLPQAYLRGASFRRSDSVLLEEPVIWNATNCIGYPAISGNVFGDLGISFAAGGQAGGGGAAAQGFVGNDDTPADAIFFGTVALTASGTHNRTDGRYGDYFTVRPNARCQNAWVATNYALLNGTATANVNARYIEFGSTLDSACF